MKKVFINMMLASLISFNFACKKKEIEVPGFVWVAQTEFTEEVVSPDGIVYRPKLKLLDDVLYVCHNKGIFSKKLNEEGSKWELFAFGGLPIIEFVKNGDKILAISHGSKNHNDSLLFLSNDNGKTYVNFSSPDLLKNEPNYVCGECNILYRIAQHPQNADIVLVFTHYGVSISEDFGLTWKSLNESNFGGQNWHLGFHPLDANTIFYSGEHLSCVGALYKSSDYGKTWSLYNTPFGDNCVHSIAFHPTNPNILIYSGEGVMGKSTDKGKTWKEMDLRETAMYFYKVLFDEDTPEILYASGAKGHAVNDSVWVYRSTDTGESWHLAFHEKLNENIWAVVDMVKHKNKLFFYSYASGIIELELEF